MKLPNFHNSWLSDIRKKIWADLVNYFIIDWKPRVAEIIAIDPQNIDISSTDNTITNKNWDRIVIYIRDIIPFEWKYNDPKIHFYNCKTIQQKMNDNTFDSRYVWAYTVTGLLSINLMWADKKNIESNKEINLGVCSNCLIEAKEDWLIEEKLLEPFSLKKYFDFYEYYRNRVNVPKYNFLNITKNQYPLNWEEISQIEKQKVKYICQDCKKDCINNKKDLHTHHVDHNKWNNFTDNFEVLCYDCHKKHHSHM